MHRQMEEPQRGIEQHGEDNDAQRNNVRLAEAFFHAQADKQRRRDQLQNRVKAVQPGNHRRIVLENENNKVGKNGGKQPLGAKAAQVHAQMLTEYAQIEG